MYKLAGIIVIVLIFIGVVFGTKVSRDFFSPLSIPESARAFTIADGEGVKQVSARLAELEIIRSDFWFRTWVWLLNKEAQFIAKPYNLPASASTAELVRLFTSGSENRVVKVKILEGWGIREIASEFESLDIRLSPGTDEASIESYLAKQKLEGYLFPDTYEVYATATVDDVIAKMRANFDRKVTAELRSEIERQGKDFDDVLIMASIIEAEVPHEEDRPIVSDIFWSRLEVDMPLQSDATLKYLIGGSRPALTSEELAMDSPYNTYKYKGLTPTPIGNPGLSAIRAAIYPAETDYFYFLSTPKGETVFSRNLDEHNAAKALYLK